VEDLNDFNLMEISGAFKSWRRANSGMPTPSNILDEIKDDRSGQYRKDDRFMNFDGSWDDYKKFLSRKGILSPNVPVKS